MKRLAAVKQWQKNAQKAAWRRAKACACSIYSHCEQHYKRKPVTEPTKGGEEAA